MTARTVFYDCRQSPPVQLGVISLKPEGGLEVDGPKWLREIANQPAGLHDVLPEAGESYLLALEQQYNGSVIRAEHLP